MTAGISPYERCYKLAFEIEAIIQREANRVAPPSRREMYIDQHAATELAELIYQRIVRKS